MVTLTTPLEQVGPVFEKVYGLAVIGSGGTSHPTTVFEQNQLRSKAMSNLSAKYSEFDKFNMSVKFEIPREMVEMWIDDRESLERFARTKVPIAFIDYVNDMIEEVKAA